MKMKKYPQQNKIVHIFFHMREVFIFFLTIYMYRKHKDNNNLGIR